MVRMKILAGFFVRLVAAQQGYCHRSTEAQKNTTQVPCFCASVANYNLPQAESIKQICAKVCNQWQQLFCRRQNPNFSLHLQLQK